MATLEPSPGRPQLPALPEGSIRLSTALPTGTFHLVLKYSAVRKLSAFLAEVEGEAYGLIAGSFAAGTAALEEMLPKRDAADAEKSPAQLLAGIQPESCAAGLKPVGIFRTQTGGWPALTDADCRLLKRCAAWLPKHGALFLVIRTFEHRPRAASLFLLGGSAGVPTETSMIEFPFDEYLLRQGYLVEPGAPAGSEPFYETHRQKPGFAGWVLACALLAGAAGGTYAYLRVHPGTALPPKLANSAPAATLGLQAVRNGGNVELSWDRSTPLVQSASAGTLTIHDGPAARVVPLSGDQLREGRIVYDAVPRSELDFRLEVTSGDGSITAESIQFLGWETEPPRPAPAEPARRRVTRSHRSEARPLPRPPAMEPPNSSPAHVPIALPEPPLLAGKSPPPTPEDYRVIGRTAPRIVEPPIQPPPRPVAVTVPPNPVPAATPPPQPAPAKAAPYVPAASTAQSKPQLNREAVEELSSAGGTISVQVRVTIDATGNLKGVNATSMNGNVASGGIFLKMAAVNAAKRWKFRPATLNGKPVESEMNLTFVFRR